LGVRVAKTWVKMQVCSYFFFKLTLYPIIPYKALKDLDLDGDWDPEAHDRQMASLYEHDEEDGGADDEKPHWDDDIDIGDIVTTSQDGKKRKNKRKKKTRGMGEDGRDGVDVDEMDADVEKVVDDNEEWDGTEEMRKRKLNEYMNEIYDLDFNDIVTISSIFPLSLLISRL